MPPKDRRLPSGAPPPCPSRLPYPRPRVEKLRIRAEMAEPGESYDQPSCKLDAGYRATARDADQGELFADEVPRRFQWVTREWDSAECAPDLEFRWSGERLRHAN
jgi:hypothetical protein